MLDDLNILFLTMSNFVWSYIILGLCVGVGLFFTLRLGFIQLRSFPHAIALLRGKYKDDDASGGITTFQALATALSSTTGIGNIAGVAVAIKLGGPGAIFWMWVMAFLGMALKYAEGTLGSLYREPVGLKGEMGGGPMAYITKGLGEKWRPVAVFYAACTAVAIFGAWNMFQSNQAAATLQDQLNVPTWVTGIVLCVFVTLVLVGGIKRIGAVAAKLVPTMCVIYVVTVLVICFMHAELIPDVLALIVSEAFNFESAGGGAMGTAILIGIRRAVFSNEAGTGSAAIAHAAAQTRYPVRQGIAASLGPFIDTIVVCAATAFVILLSGYYGTESYQNNHGEAISFEAGATPALDKNWSISAGEVAIDNGRLQQFTDGLQVLKYTPSENSAPALSPVLELSALSSSENIDAIRVSSLSNAASLRVRVFDHNSNFDSRAILIGEGESSDWTVEGRQIDGRWVSWVLKPGEELKEQLAALGGLSALSLQFEHEASSALALDRIELVSAANGIVLSSAAFAKFFGFFGTVFIPIAALFFAYSTILAGNYYGEVACHYLNDKLIKPYMWLYIASTFVGCVVSLDVVINFSDLTLGIMVIPNLIACVLLSPVVVRETKKYYAALRNGEFTLAD
ncbi:MAG: alanine/glycine:cation symporter family protein [Pseudomonadales bacterium]